MTTNQTNTRRKLIRLILFGLAMSFLLANRECDPNGVPTLSCQDVHIRLEPGTCQVFPNPCQDDGQWAHAPEIDGLRFEPQSDEMRGAIAAEKVSLDTQRVNGETLKSICVGAGVPFHDTFEIDYFYGKGTDFGQAAFWLTVAPPLSITVTASPANVAVGQEVQLLVKASGGFPPYFYSWDQNRGLDDERRAAPRVSPRQTSTYSVSVRDSAGDTQIQTGSVTVNVRSQMTVTANLPEIGVGDISQLEAIFEGGTPPYSFVWGPAATLTDPHDCCPIAHPPTTTTYNVTGTDSVGAVQTGSIKVVVRPEGEASANPASIPSGGSSQLDVIVRGGSPPYSYLWSPAAGLSNATIRNPVASPAASTTYIVTVTDAEGLRFARPATVVVNSPPTPLRASFTYRIGSGPTLVLDASTSTGNIVSYRWELSWTSLSPDLVTSSSSASFAVRETDFGTITLTVSDAAGNTATTSQPF